MKSPTRLLAIAIAVTSLAASGCLAAAAGAAVGAGTYAYVRGDLEATLASPLDEVWGATLEAVRDLGFAVREQAQDQLSARLVAAQVRGGDVSIRLERVGENATKVNIRVGTFGDEATSRLVLREIGERL